MRANRHARGIHRDEEGLSTVIGAVLLFAVFISTLVLVRVEFVPVWDEEREEAHMDQLSNELRVLASDHIRQVGNATATGITDPVTLGRTGGFTFFRGAAAQGTMSFTPRTAGLHAESAELTVLTKDGNPLFGANEDWETLFDDTVVDISQVAHLRVRIHWPVGDSGGPTPLQATTLTATDADGDFVARIIMDAYPTSANDYLRIVVDTDLDDTNAPLYREELLFQRSSKPEWFFLNALDDELQFDDQLNAATAPLTLTLEEDGMDADYTLTYVADSGGGGSVVVGNSGLAIPDYTADLPSGVLRVAVPNQRFEPQTYHLEHGAIILEQDDGAVMLVKPQFHVVVAGARLGLSWTVPGLTGAQQTVGGTPQASVVTAAPGGIVDVQAQAAHYNLTLTTSFPAVWESHFEGVFASLGLSEAQGHYDLSTTADSVTLRVFGLTTDPASTDTDIFVAFRYARVTLDLRANA